jgi:hypothetical protein
VVEPIPLILVLGNKMKVSHAQVLEKTGFRLLGAKRGNSA